MASYSIELTGSPNSVTSYFRIAQLTSELPSFESSPVHPEWRRQDVERGLSKFLGLVDEDVGDPEVPGEPGVEGGVLLALVQLLQRAIAQLQPAVHPVQPDRDLHRYYLGDLINLNEDKQLDKYPC